VPAEQAVQLLDAMAPVAAENVPAAQAVQVFDAAPPVEYDPTGQSSVQAVTLPVTVLYLPLPQAVHDCAPVAAENFPAAQTVQVFDAAPPAEYDPKGQLSAQAVVRPVLVLYLPPPQAVQTEAPTAAEKLPAAQIVQAFDAVAPVLAENLPSEQFVQDSDAANSAYIPATQMAQVDNEAWTEE